MSELLDRTLGERIHITTDIDEDVGTVFVDPHQLENGILNLAVNARDAMPDGGRLTIEARNLPAGSETPEALAPGDYLVIAVSDTGAGMPQAVLEQALTPFFTTKEKGKGTEVAEAKGKRNEGNGKADREVKVVKEVRIKEEPGSPKRPGERRRKKGGEKNQAAGRPLKRE